MIGIELDEARVTAVAVTENGAVEARVNQDVAGNDLAAHVKAILKQLRASAGTPIGFAATSPDAANVAGAIGASGQNGAGAITSGAAAAVAESWIGAARGAAHVVFFAVGDRTAGGFVRNGVPEPGARGRAASFGWMSLNPVEREDYRKIGCLETEVAAGGIVRRLIWRVKAGDRSAVQDMVGNDLSAITVQHVLDAARSGDGVSTSVVRDTAKYLGMAAANLVAIADPEALVLGGLMASASDLLLESIRLEINRRLPKTMVDGVSIIPAILGDEAAAIGAARWRSTRP